MRALVFSLVLLSAAPAFAQEAPDASVARFEEGVELLRQERYEEAAAAFRESYRLSPRVTTMCNLALSYDRWGGHRDRAVRAYRTCARDDDTGRYQAYAERRVEELERELALEEEVEATEGDPAEQTEEGDAALPPADPEPPPPVEADHTALWVGVGAGALGAGSFAAGLILALEAQADLDALRAQLGDPPRVVRGSDEHRRLEAARDAADAAIALYVVAGVATAAALTLITVDLVSAGDDPESATARLRPTGTGLAIEGQF